MKKNITMLAFILAATFITSISFANNITDPRVEKSFQQEFAGAQHIAWTELESGHTKVSFTFGGHRTEAYYSTDGQLLGTIRGLFYEQLPLAIIRSLTSKFDSPVVTEVREITNMEGTTYRVVLEMKGKRYQVRIDSHGAVIEKQKLKK